MKSVGILIIDRDVLRPRLDFDMTFAPVYIENTQEAATQAQARRQMRAHTCTKTEVRAVHVFMFHFRHTIYTYALKLSHTHALRHTS